MLYPPDGPQGGFIAPEIRGVNVGLDGFHILQPYTGFQHGGMIGRDKDGKSVPIASYKLDEDLAGIIVVDSQGKRVPVATFQTPSELGTKCGIGTNASGGTGDFLNSHRIGPLPGIVGIMWNMFQAPDQMEVYYNGDLLRYTYVPPDTSTPQQVSGVGCFYFNYSPVGHNYNIQVRILGNSSGTIWNYNVNCATGSCQYKQPNSGSYAIQVPYGGNCCTGQGNDRNQVYFPTDSPSPTDPNTDCHYSFVLCGCKSRRRTGKTYREKVTVQSFTNRSGYNLSSYTMYQYSPVRTYCTTPSSFGFNSCLSGTGSDPDLIYKPLSSIAVNQVLWDYTSDGPGCETPYHNIFFRFCKTGDTSGLETTITSTVHLLCEITEIS